MKKILLVCDVNNWAWHYKAVEIKENLSDKYEIDIVYTHAVPSYNNANLEKYDHIHIFGWYSIGNREKKYLSKISTSIASIEFQLLKPREARNILPSLTVVAVSNEMLKLLTREKLGKKIIPCYNGVNEIKFKPNPDIRKEHNQVFRVGIACKPSSKYDLYGLSLTEKIKEQLLPNKDIEIVMHLAKHKTAVSHEEMARFYNSLDLFMHTGRYHLATPNPVFEASACGVPILATTNGCIPLLIRDDINGYLIDINANDDDKITQFVEKIKYLAKNRDKTRLMGIANREEILRNWTWKQRAQDWISVFG